MVERFAFTDLNVRIIGAPMAGGPSTPELAAAVTNAGGLGFLAAGMLSADELAAVITSARQLTTGAIGVNLFVPQLHQNLEEEFCAYAAALSGEAVHYGARLGRPARHDGWAAKLDVVYDMRPDVVSFTFGAPGQRECAQLAKAGILTIGTVTSAGEAAVARSCGVDAVVVQGRQAGGHRATFDPEAAAVDIALEDLIGEVITSVDCPVVAAGGIATADDVRRVRCAGATAAQVGTALLLADEAGTNPVHRRALSDPQFDETVFTRAFTGRYARALRNRFIEEHERDSLFGFPEIAMMTAPVVAAAVRAGDPHGVSLWAGTEFRAAKAAPAAEIVRELAT